MSGKSKHCKLLMMGGLLGVVYWGQLLVSQPSYAQSDDCSTAVSSGKQRILQVRGVEAVRVERDKHQYSDGPAQRPIAYSFLFSGRGVADVMDSPVFLRAIAQTITNSCADAALVNFGVDRTDWGVSYGLIAKVEEFTCVEPGSKPSRWGETVCP
ncbi:MAG: hypothetical protein HC936_03820 [Leptolyngbyaceae cyanobacterium SU_3_3]|nr:hypothetical protein [Leptolyngbyaceae cyanobacterium SU_3_3]